MRKYYKNHRRTQPREQLLLGLGLLDAQQGSLAYDLDCGSGQDAHALAKKGFM